MAQLGYCLVKVQFLSLKGQLASGLKCVTSLETKIGGKDDDTGETTATTLVVM